jgi:hypothetical protein
VRLLQFVRGVGVGIVCIGARAEALNYPWCAQYKGGAMNCGSMTFQQCLATVTEAGLCIQNNTYQPPPGPHPQTRGQRRGSLLAQFLRRRCAPASRWACLEPIRCAASPRGTCDPEATPYEYLAAIEIKAAIATKRRLKRQ